MALSGKDALTTLLAVGVGAVYYVQAKGVDVTLLSSPRWAAVAVGVLGMIMCAAGSDPEIMKGNAWGTGMGIIAGIVGVILLVGLIGDSKVAVEIAAGVTVAMWLVATVRHAIGG